MCVIFCSKVGIDHCGCYDRKNMFGFFRYAQCYYKFLINKESKSSKEPADRNKNWNDDVF